MVSLLVATVRDSHNTFPSLLPHIFTLEQISCIRILIGMSLRTGMSLNNEHPTCIEGVS